MAGEQDKPIALWSAGYAPLPSAPSSTLYPYNLIQLLAQGYL